MKPLYSVSEVGYHWFATDHIYHEDKLKIKESTYNLCLLYCSDLCNIVEMQTDNTLILVNNDFVRKE